MKLAFSNIKCDTWQVHDEQYMKIPFFSIRYLYKIADRSREIGLHHHLNRLILYLDQLTLVYKVCGVPQDYTEALNSPHASDWQQAMTDELTSLRQNDTFDLLDLPKGKNVVKGKWVYATKEDAEGMTSSRLGT